MLPRIGFRKSLPKIAPQGGIITLSHFHIITFFYPSSPSNGWGGGVKKEPFRRNGTASTIACHIKKTYFFFFSVSTTALAAESTFFAAESTTAGATAAAVSTIVAAAVSALASVDSLEPPQDARAAIARIAKTFFIRLNLLFVNV